MRSFSEFSQARAALLGQCDEVERIWREAESGRTELEEMALDRSAPPELSSVEAVLAEARRHLSRDVIEIGVFGNVKRGKSTLFNALIGEGVSSVRVTPETAVPVWVESGPRSSFVVYDGRVVEMDSVQGAAEFASQRHRTTTGERVVRVLHKLSVPWMPPGIRLVDTPGLDDPTHVEEYTALTMAELDRVAAAVFVFVSPPGIAGDEVRMLQALARHGVSKVFLVCNFYSEHWEDHAIRAEVCEHIESIVRGASTDSMESTDIRVYAVNARAAFEATRSHDSSEYVASGVDALRRDVETYLSSEALDRQISAGARRMATARDIVLDLLLQRRDLLTRPAAAEEVRDRHKAALRRDQSIVGSILDNISSGAERLRASLSATVDEPYRVAIGELEQATKISDVERVEHAHRLRLETAASRAAVQVAEAQAVLESQARRNLFESFGFQERLRTAGLRTAALMDAVEDVGLAALTSGSADWGDIAAGAVVTGVATGLVGGSLAGGVGIALIAAGPVGWLIGLAAGGVLGALAGGAGAAAASKRALPADERSRIVGALERQRSKAAQWVDGIVNSLAKELENAVQRERDHFFATTERELAHADRVLRDRGARTHALAQVESMIAQARSL